MDNSRVPSVKKDDKDRILPENKDEAGKQSLNENYKDQVFAESEKFINQKTLNDSYAKVCTTEKANGVTKFTTKNNKPAIILSLTMSLLRLINYVLHTSGGPNLLWEELVKPDWLASERPYDITRLKSVTSQAV